jgi:hypothetical protein
MSNPQAQPTTDATDPAIQLGGNPQPSPLNAVEIAVICITVVGFVFVMFLVFYCKHLKLRREAAMLSAAEDAERGQVDTRRAGQRDTTGGGLELKNVTLLSDDKGMNGAAEPVSPDGDKVRLTHAATPIAKPPLWNFIHKKNPLSPGMNGQANHSPL